MKEIGKLGEFTLFEEGLWMGTKDKDGRVHISPDLHYRSISEFENGVAVASQRIEENAPLMWGLIDTEGNHISEFKYSYVTPCGEGYYRCEINTRKNMLRHDGSEVLSVWFNDVFKVCDGFFIVCNTIRKSKTNPKTKYMHGLANVNGDILFPPIYEMMQWVDNVKKDALLADLDGKRYVLLLTGSVYDPERAHLPKEDGKEDNFPWNGPIGTICEKCIYAKGIAEDAKGCGRLFKKSFRQNVIKGRCEYKKVDLFVPSEFEARKKRENAKNSLKEVQSNDSFAVKLLKDFITDKLDGDISKLATYDLTQLREDEKYGGCGGHAFSAEHSNIMKAIVSLAFKEAWPEITYDKIEHAEYSIGEVNTFTMLFGLPIGENFFGLKKFRPSADMLDRVWDFYGLCNSIGNFIAWPCKKGCLVLLRRDIKRSLRYIDTYLQTIHTACINGKRANMTMLSILDKDKHFAPYRSPEGFVTMCEKLLLDHYLDADGTPSSLFTGIWSDQKELGREEYFNAVEQYLDFCEKEINDRGNRIVTRLKDVLGMNDNMIEVESILKLTLPDDFEILKALPGDPEGAVSYGKETDMALCFAQAYPIDANSTMPMDDDKEIIDGIHACIADNQGIIEVRHGSTRYAKDYVYSIVKDVRKRGGVTYILTMHIKKNGQALCLRGNFEERGMTGQKDAMIFEYCRRENLVQIDPEKGTIGWSKDPYDESFTRGIPMNLSEDPKFDQTFPNHPLTQLRSFLRRIIDGN